MQQSKIELMRRLQREGRWEEASQFKDAEIARLRKERVPRIQAREAAWEAMEQAFLPLSEAEVRERLHVEKERSCHAIGAATPRRFIEDAMWVYEALGATEANADLAPTAGAWALYRWALRNEDRFFEQILPKVLNSRAIQELSSDDAAEEFLGIEEARSILEQYARTQARD